MKLALPLGLLGLLAVAALILIYILKPKYQDKKVSSTYVWRLSLRYHKRKIPFQWLKSSLLFVIQILIIAAMAFMMAQPYVVSAKRIGEKIVILDASASMQATTDVKSRFDRAKSEISALADTASAQDRFTVILAGEESEILARRSDSATYVKQKLSEAKCTFAEADLDGAMELAEGVLAENPNAEVYLYTDGGYADAGRVKVVDVSDNDWNAAVLNFTATRVKGYYVFTAEIASYGRAAELAVSLNIDGKEQLPKLAACDVNGTVSVVWDNLEIGEYSSADVHVSADDSFPYDNDFYLYSPNYERFKVQLVSDNPGFLFSALYSTGVCQVTIPDETNPEKSSGYDLYVYDGTAPDAIPTDGAVWLIDPPEDISSEWGLTISGKQSGEYALSSAGGTSETFKTIMNNISPEVIVTEYSRVVGYAGYESLMKCGADPVLLAKDDGGVKITVLAMDIHMSDIAIWPLFPLLISNMCDYSMAYTVDDSLYTVGDTIKINAKANAENLTVNAAYVAGNESSESYTEFPVIIAAELAGVYSITQELDDGSEVSSVFFVRIAQSESEFGKTEATLVNPVVVSVAGINSNMTDENTDICIYLAVALLVLLSVEWGLQYREQY